jgi:hypothetical protein
MAAASRGGLFSPVYTKSAGTITIGTAPTERSGRNMMSRNMDLKIEYKKYQHYNIKKLYFII